MALTSSPSEKTKILDLLTLKEGLRVSILRVLTDASEKETNEELISQVLLSGGKVSVVLQEGEKEPTTHEIGNANWSDEELKDLLEGVASPDELIPYLGAENFLDVFKGPLLALRFIEGKLFIARRGVRGDKEDVEILARAIVEDGIISFQSDDDSISESFWLSSLRGDANTSSEGKAILNAFKGVN